MASPPKADPFRPEQADDTPEHSGGASLLILDDDIPGEDFSPPGADEAYSQTFSGRDEVSPQEQSWVVLGDIHGYLDNLEAIPELAEANGVIISGDLTKLGGVAAARDVIEAIQRINPVVMAQIGNMDRPEVNDWLEQQGINLHCKVRELCPDVAIMGVGGSTFTPFGTPSEFPEARFAEWLEDLAKRAENHKYIIVISHNPPHDTVCDRLSSGGHAGSQALREFIEEHQPTACLCGHIHEAFGQQLLGRTVVANPGASAAGGYIVLRLGKEISVNLCKLGSVPE